ncbi:MAG: hypothetical protein AB7I41_09445 [Candidatus Sericytochromatia bacterium]
MKFLNLAALLLLSACTTTPTVTPSASPSGSASNSPTASASPAAPTGSTSAASGTLKYLGLSPTDKASPSFAGMGDGNPDYVFTYSYNFGKEVMVKSLILSRIENGKPMGQAGWSTTAGKYWLFHVSANGKDLNEGAPKTTLGTVSGQVEFVMSGASLDPGLFSAGTVYELLVTYLDGGSEKTITSRVTM